MKVDSFLTEVFKQRYSEQFHDSLFFQSGENSGDEFWLRFFLSDKFMEAVVPEHREQVFNFFAAWIQESSKSENENHGLSFWMLYNHDFRGFIGNNVPSINEYSKLRRASRTAQVQSGRISEYFVGFTVINVALGIFFLLTLLTPFASLVLVPALTSVAILELVITLCAVVDYFKNVVGPWDEQKKQIIEPPKLEKLAEAKVDDVDEQSSKKMKSIVDEIDKVVQPKIQFLMEKGAPGYWFAFWSHPLIKFESVDQSQNEIPGKHLHSD